MNLKSLTIAARGLLDTGRRAALCTASDGLLKTASKIGGRAAKARLSKRKLLRQEDLEILEFILAEES